MQESDKSKFHPKEKKFKKRKTFKKEVTRKSFGKRREEKTRVEAKQTGTSTKVMGCYICAGPHLVRECLKQEKLAGLVTEEDSDAEHSPQLNSLQVFGKQSGSSQS